MQDGASPYISTLVKDLLHTSFSENRVLSCHFHHAWPPRAHFEILTPVPTPPKNPKAGIAAGLSGPSVSHVSQTAACLERRAPLGAVKDPMLGGTDRQKIKGKHGEGDQEKPGVKKKSGKNDHSEQQGAS
ncbi:hypothetical protein TNCV_1383781 [Trichonephila clavipes]|nr:hypothetical protein TNCV_1383781 [Trichonephila clavipes]